MYDSGTSLSVFQDGVSSVDVHHCRLNLHRKAVIGDAQNGAYNSNEALPNAIGSSKEKLLNRSSPYLCYRSNSSKGKGELVEFLRLL